MQKKPKFPSLTEINNAQVPQIEKWYNTLKSPKPEELDSMKTIIRKHMTIRRLKREGQLL